MVGVLVSTVCMICREGGMSNESERSAVPVENVAGWCEVEIVCGCGGY